MRIAIALAIGLFPASALAGQIDDARAAVITKLKDPESARFGEMTVKGDVVCGTVNAKNAMGGYPGAHRFYYGADVNRAFIEGGADISTDPLDLYAGNYSKFCR
jgi:hypothetical protein